MKPTLAVLMPFRRAHATLARACASVLRAREVDVLLAIDDNAPEERERDLNALPNDPRIDVLHSGGVGIPQALEFARARTTATYLGRMDADDVCIGARFAHQLEAMARNPRLGAVGALTEPFADDEGALGEGFRRYVAWQNTLRSADAHRRELFIESPLCHPSTLLRASAVEQIGGYRDGDFPEDYDLWLRLDAAGYDLEKIPLPGVRWRQSASQATFTDPRYSLKAFRRHKASFLAARLAELRKGRQLAVWGAGQTGKRTMRLLEAHQQRADCWIDIDPAKVGRTARGAPIVAAADTPRDHFVLVLVGARGARAEVYAFLEAQGRVHGVDFLAGS